ncbi:MAG: efflux RND transporter periplasmic adaptor subunit [Kiritimatiellia bacterium]|jgi:Cu(I)/Ag(I) efflux system membrane fusion protein|nr:efflux RND transporter periplasmic adaptor subunit [Kiritimatiellia bacterium]
MKEKNIKRIILIALGLGLLVGIVVGRGCASRPAALGADAGRDPAPETQADVWTCSMHPQIRLPGPGQCPICGMDLIPVEMGMSEDSASPRELSLSPGARQLAKIEVAPVERKSVAIDIRMVGKVQFDETRLAVISPRVDGRLDRLYANFVGIPVKAGDPLADLYSPELVAAQQELLQAVTSTGSREASASLLKATRERLRLWGLTDEQVAEIEQSGHVRDHVTFVAPIGGIVVEKEAREGQYVEAGMRLFTVADLSRVWVQLDAYESDLGWLRIGQTVELQTEAYPGDTFTGPIAFISPVLDPMTRTVKVRVEVANTDERLKPEMFVHAVVQAAATENGSQMPLVIPASAPLVTGKRAVVYVAVPDKEQTYEGREVELGPRAGDFYLVRAGLQEGEHVVTRGAFKLDAELQIRAKPSMMTPEGGGGGEMAGMDHGEKKMTPGEMEPENPAFSDSLAPLFQSYLSMQKHLADDTLSGAVDSARAALTALDAVDMDVLNEHDHRRWMTQEKEIRAALEQFQSAGDMASARRAFSTLSTTMSAVAGRFSPPLGTLYLFSCPMAFGTESAVWLQSSDQIANPYLGAAMLRCGELEQPYTGINEAAK